MHSLHTFSDRTSMIIALADALEARLSADIIAHGKAFWLVSGGSTPKPLFTELSSRPLDWKNIFIALGDERFVPENHPRSNTSMVRDVLLREHAVKASYIPIIGGDDLASVASGANQRYKDIGLVPSSILLGLGPDGHTASLFPGAKGLEDAMDMASHDVIKPLTANRSEVTGDETERLTITRPFIASAQNVVLMITGHDKRAVFDQAMKSLENPENGENPENDLLPIARIVKELDRPLQLYWAP